MSRDLFRISPFPDLSGIGGEYASGRWHTKGQRIVYLADHPAAAMLELLVHTEIDIEDVPDTFNLLRVSVPDNAEIAFINELPENWRELQELSREIGDNWLEANETMLLVVPSAIMPHSANTLLNPAHPGAKDVRLKVETHRIDKRLLRPS